jgi:S-adenosylmethionine decarboxylase
MSYIGGMLPDPLACRQRMSGRQGAAGLHILADFFGVAPTLLADAAFLERLLRDAARAAGAEILLCRLHSFGRGAGVTGVLLLAESHLSIHTWPERGFAAVDAFMCGSADPGRAIEVIAAGLTPESREIQSCLRGQV